MADVAIKFDNETSLFPNARPHLTVERVKNLGMEKSDANLHFLISAFYEDYPLEIRREIASSIGRQENADEIFMFLSCEAFNNHPMEIIYQMFRTVLYRQDDLRFKELGKRILAKYDNEILNKMAAFYEYRKSEKIEKPKVRQIKTPALLVGDNVKTLEKIGDGQVNLVFTSPPYYNARIYSDYTSYKSYLQAMLKTLRQVHRVLEDGRFCIINVSPVITKRAGRDFESIRYPIHFDFHQILQEAGFHFIDEIIWIKPEYTVPNRVGGYLQTQMPLAYKPNCITESVMVYRKNAPFLLDKNIRKYSKSLANGDEKIETTNCWYINPTSDKNHPAVFPEELCEKVLKYYSFKGDVVCDPFAGSGTFGRVAIKMQRTPILCEMNEKYANHLRMQGVYDEI